MKKREKRRKQNKWINRVLNVLIFAVIGAIAVISYYVFLNQGVAEVKQPSVLPSVEAKEPVEQEKQDRMSREQLQWIQEKMDDTNVIETMYQPEWESVKTIQVEPHQVKFEIGSQDWIEMKQCIAYATNLTFRDFVVQHIGRGEKDSQAIGIISTKDGHYHYRVYMEWITGKGWKPMLVQQLKRVMY